MNIQPVVHQYSLALLETAHSKGIGDLISTDLILIRQCIEEFPAILQRLSSPILDRKSRQVIFENTFTGKIHAITLNFLKVIANNNRLCLLPEIINGYFSLADTKNNVVDAIIESAKRLDDSQQEVIKDKLDIRYSRTFHCSFRQNPSLIGGFTVHFEDTFIDNSISGKLKQLRHTMRHI